MSEQFHNPYHFVPVKRGCRTNNLSMSDFWGPENRYARHDLYDVDGRSGRIICRLRTLTPIFVGARRTREPTKEQPGYVRPFELDGKPAIPGTTLRGLISSVAEAASNSALRILENRPLSFRKPPAKALSAIGMVVEDPQRKGCFRLRPLTLPTFEFKAGDGTATLPDSSRGFLPILKEFRKCKLSLPLKVYVGATNKEPEELNILKRSFSYRTYTAANPKFYGMKVSSGVSTVNNDGHLVSHKQQQIVSREMTSYIVAQKPQDSEIKPWDDGLKNKGFTRGIMRVLGVWGRKVPRQKKHELFIPFPPEAETERWPSIPIPDKILRNFQNLADERSEEDRELPYEPRETRARKDEKRLRLRKGDLVYFRPSDDGTEVAELSFSAIWRDQAKMCGSSDQTATCWDFFRKTDPELLPLNPCRDSLTPAELLFGAVSEKSGNEADKAGGKGSGGARLEALAGRLRFSAAAIASIDDRPYSEWLQQEVGRSPYLEAATLKILAGPKPPCPEFYFKMRDGTAAFIQKEDLNVHDHAPQGRKFYLHRDGTCEEPASNKFDRERFWKTRYRDQDRKQKTEIMCLRPGATFYFHVDFENLSELELSLLLYSLSPSGRFRHKIGMGKPLGLGTVQIEPVALLSIERRTRYGADGFFQHRYKAGQVFVEGDENASALPGDLLQRYERDFNEAGEQEIKTRVDLDTMRAGFRKAMKKSQGGKAILSALERIGDPGAVCEAVHYPHTSDRDDETKNYEWFVENRRSESGRRKTLVPLGPANDWMPALEVYDRRRARAQNSRKGNRRPRR